MMSLAVKHRSKSGRVHVVDGYTEMELQRLNMEVLEVGDYGYLVEKYNVPLKHRRAKIYPSKS